MLEIVAKLVASLDPKPVLDAAKKATFRSLQHAAASIRKAEIASIKPEAGPAPAGQPPHTHTGKGKRKGVLPRAIAFSVDGDTAVIGPRESVAGDVGHGLEDGGEFRGENLPARPFAAPALAAAVPRLGSEWVGAIGP